MSYETNLTDARWEIIAEYIEDGRRRKYGLRAIVDALSVCRQNRVSMAIFTERFSEVATGLLLFSQI